MKKLVIDIETVGFPWEEQDPYVREYLIKGLNDGDAEETRRAGGLSPFRGKIVAIGVINIDDRRSCAMYEIPGQKDLRIERVGPRTYMSGTEKQILEKFWEFFVSDSRFISFNGRQFKFNLDLACKAFGVETSKSEGIDGRSVETWYRAGRHREIADYCLEDVRATAELYEKLAPTILIFNREFKEAEERSRKSKPEPASEIQDSLPILPTSEALFMESVEQSSLNLTSSLDQADQQPSEVAVSTGKHQAIILDKLIQSEEREEEIPDGV